MRTQFLVLCLAGAFAALPAVAADPLPPKPTAYVTDSAGILSAQTVAEWNKKLDAYERETSNQILAYIMPSVPDDYALEDFANRAFISWGVGQKKENNGAVLFIFPNDHKMKIEVGYGLEGALPDATAKAILDNEVRPAFRAGNFDGGVSRGLEAMLSAVRGEYKGTGRTDNDNLIEVPLSAAIFMIIIVGFVFFGYVIKSRHGVTYGRRGRKHKSSGVWGSSWSSGGSWSSGSSGGWSSDSDGGGGWSGGSDGGGGFSGGGGSSGGGGASGSW